MWPWRRNKKFGKMHKFAEIWIVCQKREFFTIFHHSYENGSSSANFEARPLILLANENSEQVLIFSWPCGVIKVRFQQEKFISFHGKKNYDQFWGKNGAKYQLPSRLWRALTRHRKIFLTRDQFYVFGNHRTWILSILGASGENCQYVVGGAYMPPPRVK